MRDADSEVFKALADPTRRSILDGLFQRDGQTLQALCDRCPQMTRFGVMKHLGVLEAANLVATKRVGRTKLHYLNPIPIGEIADTGSASTPSHLPAQWLVFVATSSAACRNQPGGARNGHHQARLPDLHQGLAG